jgi:hypothetical protein
VGYKACKPKKKKKYDLDTSTIDAYFPIIESQILSHHLLKCRAQSAQKFASLHEKGLSLLQRSKMLKVKYILDSARQGQPELELSNCPQSYTFTQLCHHAGRFSAICNLVMEHRNICWRVNNKYPHNSPFSSFSDRILEQCF